MDDRRIEAALRAGRPDEPQYRGDIAELLRARATSPSQPDQVGHDSRHRDSATSPATEVARVRGRSCSVGPVARRVGHHRSPRRSTLRLDPDDHLRRTNLIDHSRHPAP